MSLSVSVTFYETPDLYTSHTHPSSNTVGLG